MASQSSRPSNIVQPTYLEQGPSQSKSYEEYLWLVKRLKMLTLFKRLEEDFFYMLIGMMRKRILVKGEYLFNEHAFRDTFYVIQSGRFRVYEMRRSRSEFVTVLSENDCIQELALIQVPTRPCSVLAESDGIVWYLHTSHYFKLVTRALQAKTSRNLHLVEKLPAFKHMKADQKLVLAHFMEPKTFHDKAQILKKGDKMEGLHIIINGTVAVKDIKPTHTSVVYLNPGKCFGTCNLNGQDEYAAQSATAVGTVKVMFLSAKTIGRVADSARAPNKS